jgi:hypothetical protein
VNANDELLTKPFPFAVKRKPKGEYRSKRDFYLAAHIVSSTVVYKDDDDYDTKERFYTRACPMS